jgi:hypothetical protein
MDKRFEAAEAGKLDYQADRRLAAGDPAELAGWKDHTIRALLWESPRRAVYRRAAPPPAGNDDDPPPTPPDEE